jgi:hypothetical protein
MLFGVGLLLLTSGDNDMAWQRPSDWPAMPTTAANQIDILAAVTNDASNYVAVRATVSSGTFNVDWGDGTTTTGVTSGTNAEKQYTYSTLSTSVTSRGYKTAMIKITPNTGGANITAFDIGQKHSRTNLGAYSNPWLDIQINAPSCASMAYRGGVEARMVERIAIVAIGAVTTLASAFQNCSSLQSVAFPSGSLASVTTLASAFLSCFSLRSVAFPSGSLASVTTLANAFWNCYSLQSVAFPSGSLGLVADMASAFLSCFSLQSVAFPSGSLASVTTLASAFQNCSSLQSVAFPSGSLGLVADTTSAFASCGSLALIQNCGIPISFSVASAKLAGLQLDEIYTALPSVTATITVSTNHGTVDDTPSIASGKGWTVTGT